MWNFWKKKQKVKIYKSVDEYLDTTLIPSMTIEELDDLYENNQIENETDKKITQKILEAERDWVISIHSLNDFLTILEKEIGGIVTKSSLKGLLKKYNQTVTNYAWECESLCYLLEIFELTPETELRKIFFDLCNRLETE